MKNKKIQITQNEYRQMKRDRQRLLKIKSYVALINKIVCQLEENKPNK